MASMKQARYNASSTLANFIGQDLNNCGVRVYIGPPRHGWHLAI
jgi:hypothetical protein